MPCWVLLLLMTGCCMSVIALRAAPFDPSSAGPPPAAALVPAGNPAAKGECIQIIRRIDIVAPWSEWTDPHQSQLCAYAECSSAMQAASPHLDSSASSFHSPFLRQRHNRIVVAHCIELFKHARVAIYAHFF